jgi:esterase/lipase superfamily enzyme
MRDTYRIETLILAAPDIDLGVMEQRLVAETFGIGFGQINVYLYPEDNALGVASWLFGAPRFGAARPEQMSLESRAVFRGVKSVHFIPVQDADEFDRHNYFRRHPGVLPDIAITIRTGARPSDPERPLKHLDLNFWSIDKSCAPSYSDHLKNSGG